MSHGSSALAEIDPHHAREHLPLDRLLRARGDRPRVIDVYPGRRAAPPRSRRSTRASCRRCAAPSGSSALAEIDPLGAVEKVACCGLLRARGDRPCAGERLSAATAAPPRSRRSTRCPMERWRAAPGSSALAEIDPAQDRRGTPAPRLLRARGDRPPGVSFVPVVCQAPPRSRRSTPRPCVVVARDGGSSALAEIDPIRSAPVQPSGGLLRARGDRPVLAPSTPAHHGAPPRSRRSTQDGQRSPRALPGSSALAEIDPRPCSPSRRRGRLLRARGDRPSTTLPSSNRGEAPPRSRRSTRDAVPMSARDSGSSALAEIDPSAPGHGCARGRLLRARGDRPVGQGGQYSATKAPPRSRRSTRDGLVQRHRAAGSSALAEIDPSAEIFPPCR